MYTYITFNLHYIDW